MGRLYFCRLTSDDVNFTGEFWFLSPLCIDGLIDYVDIYDVTPDTCSGSASKISTDVEHRRELVVNVTDNSTVVNYSELIYLGKNDYSRLTELSIPVFCS